MTIHPFVYLELHSPESSSSFKMVELHKKDLTRWETLIFHGVGLEEKIECKSCLDV